MATPTQRTSTGTPVHYSGAESVQANPPGTGLVICRGLCHVSQAKSHLDFHPLSKTWSVEHLLLQITPGTHWCYSWVGCFPSTHAHVLNTRITLPHVINQDAIECPIGETIPRYSDQLRNTKQLMVRTCVA